MVQVLTTEPVFEYVVDHLPKTSYLAKFRHVTEEGNDPSSRFKKIFKNKLNLKISLVTNVQTTNKTIEGLITLAEENKVPILNVTETQTSDGKHILNGCQINIINLKKS